jgi:hypothetical protein
MVRLAQILIESRAKMSIAKSHLKRLDDLKKDIEECEKIQESIVGLKKTKERMKHPSFPDYDLGKSHIEYFYCKNIDKDDIGHSDRPKLKKDCPGCDSQAPVLMSYEQSYDSPDGDKWTKTAFTVCECGKYNELKSTSRNHRFL